MHCNKTNNNHPKTTKPKYPPKVLSSTLPLCWVSLNSVVRVSKSWSALCFVPASLTRFNVHITWTAFHIWEQNLTWVYRTKDTQGQPKAQQFISSGREGGKMLPGEGLSFLEMNSCLSSQEKELAPIFSISWASAALSHKVQSWASCQSYTAVSQRSEQFRPRPGHCNLVRGSHLLIHRRYTQGYSSKQPSTQFTQLTQSAFKQIWLRSPLSSGWNLWDCAGFKDASMPLRTRNSKPAMPLSKFHKHFHFSCCKLPWNVRNIQPVKSFSKNGDRFQHKIKET